MELTRIFFFFFVNSICTKINLHLSFCYLMRNYQQYSFAFVMIQSKSDKILSALDLNKARTILFLGRPYTPKRILPIKVWITLYKPNISPVLCRCEICLKCYIHPLRDSVSSMKFAHHCSREHAELL